MKKIVKLVLVLGAALAFALAVPGIANANPSSASATCQGGVTYQGHDYPSAKKNTVVVRIDGNVVETKTFGSIVSGNVPNPDKTESHTWSVVWDRFNGTDGDRTQSGSIASCETPDTTVPDTTVPETTVPVTTVTPTTVPVTTVPATTVPATTVPTTATTVPATTTTTTAPAVVVTTTTTTLPPAPPAEAPLPITGRSSWDLVYIALLLVAGGAFAVGMGRNHSRPRRG